MATTDLIMILTARNYVVLFDIGLLSKTVGSEYIVIVKGNTLQDLPLKHAAGRG
jgi:hypothetical protein